MPVRLILLVAVLVAAVLLCLPLDAFADVLDAPAVPFEPPSADAFAAGGALAVVIIIALVRALRGVFPDQLAPAPATLASKRLLVLACALLGVGAGLVGLAPQVTAGVVGQILGGLATGSIAFVAAGVIGAEARGERPVSDPSPPL